jgi:hypothetical protein
MPSSSPEALSRKRQRRRERRLEKKAAIPAVASVIISTNRKWRLGPPAPEMSKAELRRMFAEAMQRTAEL